MAALKGMLDPKQADRRRSAYDQLMRFTTQQRAKCSQRLEKPSQSPASGVSLNGSCSVTHLRPQTAYSKMAGMRPAISRLCADGDPKR
jgi:hypothetical protein